MLRYAFPVAETGFDPAQISDLYSRIVTAHIFEAPYDYDHLARPYKVRAGDRRGACPRSSDDYRTFIVRLKPGIFFADDPAFGGKPRELVADDFVYSLQAHLRPGDEEPVRRASLEEQGIVGLRELRDEALKSKRFDYDRDGRGPARARPLHAARPAARVAAALHLHRWPSPDIYGAVAREVVERYGDRIMEHPVGTGPFRLTEWRRSSRIVLERNPRYRERFYDAEPNADDAAGQALLQRFKGRRLPMLDRVEISIIEETQPRWLAFLNDEHDLLDRLPAEFVDQAVPRGKLAPNLAKRGIRAHRVPAPTCA